MRIQSLNIIGILLSASIALISCDSVDSGAASMSEGSRESEQNYGFRNYKLESLLTEYDNQFYLTDFDSVSTLMQGYFKLPHEPLDGDKIVMIRGMFFKARLTSVTVFVQSDEAEKYISALSTRYGKPSSESTKDKLYWVNSRMVVELSRADFQAEGKNLLKIDYTSVKLSEQFTKERNERLTSEL